jgi:hypothetical protein
MTSLAIAILLLSAPASAQATGAADPLFDPAVACTIADDTMFSAPESTPEPAPRSLVLAAESRVNQEEAGQQAISYAVRTDRTAPSGLSRIRLESPGRAWPFALAAAADAATTYWALGRGGAERNPLLALGRADVGMVKMIQFPLLAKAVDLIGARDPRLGRRLRWATLAFHAVLAFNNVRLGAVAAQRGRTTRASGTP